MRTTMDIDEDVLSSARSLARAQGRSVGAVLSSLARRGLQTSVPTGTGEGGFPVFAVTSGDGRSPPRWCARRRTTRPERAVTAHKLVTLVPPT